MIFSSNSAAFGDEVSNVTFRINDLDDSGWRDTLRIEAYDANGTAVPVTLTLGTNHSGADNDSVPGEESLTVNNGSGNANSQSEQASAHIEVPGPVSQIVVTYGNLETGGQIIDITDVFFDANPPASGDDTVSGGGGNDNIFAGAGADSVLGGQGSDTIDGGDGNDTIDGGPGRT